MGESLTGHLTVNLSPVGPARHNKDWTQIHSNTPTVETLATTDIDTGPKLLKHRRRKPLGEDVDELRGGRNVKDTNISNGDVLANEVEVNLDMLRALMLDGVGGEVDDADVVAVDQGAPRQRTVDLQ
jgi:hypothetical protein